MSLIFLPCDAILCIINFLKKEYIFDDDDICENEKQIIRENGEGVYCPIFYLYATCSGFKWLNKFEYICVETGEFYANIISRNINGTLSGMGYNGTTTTGILGYFCYSNGNLTYENTLSTCSHYHYRTVNSVKYFEDPLCRRWWSNCEEGCKTCIKLNDIQHQIFSKDNEIKNIFESDYDDGTIIIRNPGQLFQFDYCVKNLKRVSIDEQNYINFIEM